MLLLATGSEVQLALKAFDALAAESVAARVISMPSWELFEQQPRDYREHVLPPSITARVAVEAGVRQGWERYIGDRGEFVGMSTFGASAPGDVAFKNFGITSDNVLAACRRVLG